jgi:SagB-type dehydrogenase family enzyme
MKIQELKAKYQEKDQSMYGSARVKDLLGVLYHENTKMDAFTYRKQGETIGYFSDPYVVERCNQPYKHYPGHKKIDLQKFNHGLNDEQEVLRLISERRSTRAFDPEYQVSLNELFHVLHYGYGVTQKQAIPNTDASIGYRSVPSAGALYPLEIYVALFNSHVEPGLYHYQEKNNELELLEPGNHLEKLRRIISAEPYIDINSANGAIIITGLIERLGIKYGERGYRFLQQETGFVTYLMSLLLEHIGLGACVAGMFLDDDLNDFLGVDGLYETAQNTLIFGKKAKQ